MATSSRDRLIHVFKVGPEYSFLQTLDDHSASIPSVKFNGQHISRRVVVYVIKFQEKFLVYLHSRMYSKVITLTFC